MKKEKNLMNDLFGYTPEQFSASRIATQYGINNTIPDKWLPNLAHFNNIMFKRTIDYNLYLISGYRSEVLNKYFDGNYRRRHDMCLSADFLASKENIQKLLLNIKEEHFLRVFEYRPLHQIVHISIYSESQSFIIGKSERFPLFINLNELFIEI
ncbi:MAG: hypothetical protein LBP63_09985 [Prevotellaceae bacterium]|jgi:hypothetical protein|nr:hypothetical protein [Prevotellaceae bacterium]